MISESENIKPTDVELEVSNIVTLIVRKRTVIPLVIGIVTILTISPVLGTQSTNAQRDSGLRVIVHLFSDPFDRTYVEIADDDGDEYDSKDSLLQDLMVQEMLNF